MTLKEAIEAADNQCPALRECITEHIKVAPCRWTGHAAVRAVARVAWETGGESVLRAVEAELQRRGYLRPGDKVNVALPECVVEAADGD